MLAAALAPHLAAPVNRSGDRWDVVVVGAGPAGGAAATILAGRGLRVLLVERSPMPRPKVCGGCLAAGGIELLDGAVAVGLAAVRDGAPFRRVELVARGRRVAVGPGGGRVVLRDALDLGLVLAAERAGATFRDGVRARVGPWEEGGRRVELTHGTVTETVTATVVVCAGGLDGALAVEGPELVPVVRRGSRLGVGAVIPGAVERPGTVRMVVGRTGYVGTAVTADGRTVVGAALDRDALRRPGGVGGLLAALWKEAGVPPVPGAGKARWTGTASLTRSVRVPAAPGLVLVGDAAAYEEPFTGEGMTWALASALAAAPLVAEAASGRWRDLAPRWTRIHRRLLGLRRLRCRTVARAVRSPSLAAAAVLLLSRFPALAAGAVSPFAGVPRNLEADA